MGTDDGSALESRIRFLQNQIIDLGYKYEVSPDSLPLLEALVADLFQTTDSLKHYKELSQGCLQACQELETFVDAYKKDNARLIAELNSLNLNTITDKSSYEKKIIDLEKQIQLLKNQNVNDGKHCSKSNFSRSNTRVVTCKSSNEKCDFCARLLQNKDNEIKQLHCEILRLNNLLSGGRPIDVLFKQEQNRRYVDPESCCMLRNDAKFQHLMSVLHNEHEAKCHAVKHIEHSDKLIEHQHQKLHDEINRLKNSCKNLEDLKSELEKELKSLRQTNQHLESTNEKFKKEVSELLKRNEEYQTKQTDRERQLEAINSNLDKELLELKRSSQEKSAEKSHIENQLKKCVDEKKHLSNRVHELSVTEKDLTIEISRLSNINAIHKRHILELENKLLEVYQTKEKEELTSRFDLLINKKPLEKRSVVNKTVQSKLNKGRFKNPSSQQSTASDSKVTENKLLPYIRDTREKYQKQVNDIQESDNDVLSFVKRLEEETRLSVESARAVQRQLESQLESTLKQLELTEKQKNDFERELLIMKDTNASVEEQLAYKESRISHLEQLVANVQKQVESSSATSTASRNAEEIHRKSLLELERLRNQVKELEKVKDSLQIDNRKLQNEMATLTQDYLSCKTEMEKAKKETQDMRNQMHDYIAKVRAAEETLQQKDKERSDMLDHFRTLTIEATQLESNNQSLESEARSTRNALRNAESKIADLQHVIQNKDALINGYEEQLGELTKTVANLETQISNLTDHRDRLKMNLDSCEELRSQIDSDRDNLSSTVSSVKMSNKKMEKELLRLQTENQCLQEQISNEKINVNTLEKLLSKARENKFDHNISISELQEEIRGLKANIKCLQESLEGLGKKLRTSQNEAAEYQRQVVQLNRDLTNLQFERIRNSANNDTINYSTL
ncbi:myosin-2 heavy chain, non muscle-like [Planococcus citri]|uniref:myosin-2 heavy chain, non muscle-like n=1 Tax=Planococcus citri TaxID=170843 RepID=UPI0031FA1779